MQELKRVDTELEKSEEIKVALDKVRNELPEEDRDYFNYHYYRFFVTLQALSGIPEAKDKCKILDVGCMPGHLSMAMKYLGHEVFGISHDLDSAGDYPEIPLRECNVELDQLPFEDLSFDIVVFTEVIEHLPVSPLPVLKEIHRVLRKDCGYLILTTPNQLYLFRRLLTLKNIVLFKSYFDNLEGLKKRLRVKSIYDTHNIKYTMKELEIILNWCHFEVICRRWESPRNWIGRVFSLPKSATVSGLLSLPVKILFHFGLNLLTLLVPQVRHMLLIIAKPVKIKDDIDRSK